MKGKKLLQEAQKLLVKISEYPNQLSSEEKHILYRNYSELVRRSAYSGNPEGQFRYAQTFESMSFLGVNNPLYNVKKCIFWYSKAAVAGFAEASNNLADFYERGVGVEKNLSICYSLYKKAAELGSPNGGKNLKIFERDIKKGKIILPMTKI
ncbi:tetratricopeptide repeat protein [Sphingobacterium endophyticum]|uniref:tetratricopeptide repeat protein n=1 Tax=Sphingobacterium endophyticum TaxID=2546448 RepID=UPI0018CCB450|nr:tetratricopeptide repeat protein [Sphingobacterium endophyticum]